jgi:hypothetical protein
MKKMLLSYFIFKRHWCAFYQVHLHLLNMLKAKTNGDCEELEYPKYYLGFWFLADWFETTLVWKRTGLESPYKISIFFIKVSSSKFSFVSILIWLYFVWSKNVCFRCSMKRTDGRDKLIHVNFVGLANRDKYVK